jgi:hypothetical protein
LWWTAADHEQQDHQAQPGGPYERTPPIIPTTPRTPSANFRRRWVSEWLAHQSATEFDQRGSDTRTGTMWIYAGRWQVILPFDLSLLHPVRVARLYVRHRAATEHRLRQLASVSAPIPARTPWSSSLLLTNGVKQTTDKYNPTLDYLHRLSCLFFLRHGLRHCA